MGAEWFQPKSQPKSSAPPSWYSGSSVNQGSAMEGFGSMGGMNSAFSGEGNRGGRQRSGAGEKYGTDWLERGY